MKFHIENDTLTITLEGVERFWAIRHKLVVPKLSIERATWDESTNIPRKELGWRIGGTAIPGILLAGRFLGSEGRNFVYLEHARGFLRAIQVEHVLMLELHDYPYRRLFLTVNDPDIAEQIVAWWSSSV